MPELNESSVIQGASDHAAKAYMGEKLENRENSA